MTEEWLLGGPMTLADINDRVVAAALGYPEAWEDHPWGEVAVKVRKKAFVFCHVGDVDSDHPGLWMTVKLPHSSAEVAAQPWAGPSGYGLGRHGWVTVHATDDLAGSLDVGWLLEMVDESYRAVAPKTLVRTLPPLPES